MFRATTSSPVRSTGISDMPAVDGNSGEVGGHAVNTATPGTPRATLMAPAPDFDARPALLDQTQEIQNQAQTDQQLCRTPGVLPDGSLTPEQSRKRKSIALYTRNHPSGKDRAYPHLRRREWGGGFKLGYYSDSLEALRKMIAQQPLPPEVFIHGLAPDWADRPTFDKRFAGDATFMDEDVVCVEGHDFGDVKTEIMALASGDTFSAPSKEVKVQVVNGKTILPFSRELENMKTRMTATTCHVMLLLDKDPNAFATSKMPTNAEALESYLSEIPGAGVPTRHHFNSLQALEAALKANGPLVLQTCHLVPKDLDEEDPLDRFKHQQLERSVEYDTRSHHVVLDALNIVPGDIESSTAWIRDPAWSRSMLVKAASLLRVPEGADLNVESKDYGGYEILEQRKAPVATPQMEIEAKRQMTYTEQAATIKQLQNTVAEQAARIAHLEALLAARQQ